MLLIDTFLISVIVITIANQKISISKQTQLIPVRIDEKEA